MDTLGKNPKMLFQQDNAPCHASTMTRNWFTQKKIKLLIWPAQSPDLSPIEHIWDVIQRQIDSRPNGPSNLQELQSVVVEEWGKIPRSTLQKLIEGMPRRLKALGEVKGLQTKY